MQRYQGYSRLNGFSSPPTNPCNVTVYYAGTVVAASIFSDNLVPPTARANPFVADADGYFYFYAPDGRYDVNFSGGDVTTPYTWADVALLGGAEDADITATQNNLAAETTLYSTTLPANTILPNKKRVRITSRGTFAANANAKRLRMKYGATTIYDSTLVVSGGNWEVVGEVTRTTPNAQTAFAKGKVQTAAGLTFSVGLQRTTPAEAATAAVTVATTAQGVATADIVHDQSYTEEQN